MSNRYIITSKKLIKKITEKITKANSFVNQYNKLGKTPAMPSNAFLNMANSMYLMGCFKEAEDLLQSAICFPTRSSNALINLGVIKQTLGNFEEAIEFYKSAIEKDSQNTKALSLWGNCLAMMNKSEEAIAKYEEAININNEDGDVYLSWGALLIKQKKHNEAKEKLDLAVKYNKKDARPLYMLSIVEIEMGNYDSALEKLEFIVKSTENNFEALHNMAYIYFKKNDFDNAIKYAKQSLAIFQHKIETYLLLGDIYAIRNQEKESLQFFKMAEMNGLRTFFLYMSWGVALQKFNYHETAIEKFLQANELLKSKKCDELYARLAISYFKTEQMELATESKNKALEINPHSYLANSIGAELEIINQNYDEAFKLLKFCENDFENKGYNYMLMAKCYSAQNNHEQAKQYFEKAIEYSPKEKEIYKQYCLYLIQQNNFETAKKKIKVIVSKGEIDINLLNIYFVALYNIAKQDSCKYNIESAIEVAERAEKINNDLFLYKDEKEELKGLLKNND